MAVALTFITAADFFAKVPVDGAELYYTDLDGGQCAPLAVQTTAERIWVCAERIAVADARLVGAKPLHTYQLL